MKTVHPLFHRPLLPCVAAMAFLSVANEASAVVIAGYNFSTGSITNGNTATASAANTAAAQPGATPSAFTLVGATGTDPTAISISGGTNTAYIQGGYTPVASSIYTGTRCFTFNVSLTSAYNLGSLTFQYGGTNTSGAAVNFTYGAQIQIGAGAFTDLATATGAVPNATSNYLGVGTYTADLSAYQNITETVTLRIFIADDTDNNAATARIKNVELNATAVPEPATAASLIAGLATFALRRRRRA